MSTSAFGAAIQKRFGVTSTSTLLSTAYPGAPITFTRLKRGDASGEWTGSVAAEHALTLQVMARPMAGYEIRVDGRQRQAPPLRRGQSLLFDLQTDPRVRFASEFDFVRCYLSREALENAARQLSGQPFVGADPSRLALDDGRIDHLVQCLLPALERPGLANPLFIDHVSLALTAHLVGVLGADLKRPGTGGLLPWQERTAKEMIDASLDGDLSMAEVAGACGLSSSHFARAFRQSTGIPPHQWLLRRRTDRAQALLRRNDLSLADVARLCGFCDQSHFNRIFLRFVGHPPGVWRGEYAMRSRSST